MKNNNVSSKEEIIKMLFETGVNVTQATISRDIKVLGLSKFSDSKGSYYGVGNEKSAGVFPYSDYVISVDLLNLNALN